MFALQFVGGRDAGPGLGDHGLEVGLSLLKFGQFLATLGFLDVVLGYTVLLKASEGDFLVEKLGMGGLAAGGTLGNLPLGEANLVGPAKDGVLQNGTGTILGLQRLGNLEKLKINQNFVLKFFFH